MPFDPISYSLAKKKSEAVINSTSPPEINKFWYDANRGVLRGYSFKSGEWRFLSLYKYDDFDNPGYGGWRLNIQIPISTSPSESVQYCVEINGDNIYVKSNDLTKNLVTGTGGTTFWQNVGGINDIRVFDENYAQNYFWIEELDTANQVCKIWVKLNAGQTVVGIAFGNPYAGVSSYHNGDMTFEFFDDFDGTSLDTNKWSLNIGTPSIQDSTILTTSHFRITSKITFTGNMVFDSKFRRNGDNNQDTSIGVVLYDSSSGSIDTNTRFGFGIHDYGDNFYHEFVSFSYKKIGAADDNFHRYVYRFYWDGTNFNGVYIKDGVTDTATSTTNYSSSSYKFWIDSGSCVVDYIFVRKYVSSDLSFGTPKVDTF